MDVYEQYYRKLDIEYDEAQKPRFGKRGPKKQDVGMFLAMAAFVGALAYWNKNRKPGTRLGKEPHKPAARQGLSAGAAAARAAELRAAGISQLTPLGKALLVAEKVDDLEADAKVLIRTVQGEGRVEGDNKTEQRRLIELVSQAQIEMDGIMVDESARGIKKAQIHRMERIIVSLENLAEIAHKGVSQMGVASSSEIQEEPEGS